LENEILATYYMLGYMGVLIIMFYIGMVEYWEALIFLFVGGYVLFRRSFKKR